MSVGISFQWHDRIDDVSDAWGACFSNSQVVEAFGLHKAVEAAQLPETRHYYLVGTIDGKPACVAPCFAFTVSLVAIAGPAVQRLVALARRAWPGFLRVRLFVLGTPISTCGHLLGLSPALTAEERDEVLRAVCVEATRKAAALGIGLTMLKEVDATTRDRLTRLLGERFLVADSLPTMYLPLPKSRRGGYLAAIRSKYRTKVNHRADLAATGALRWRTITDLTGAADEIYRLYLEVLQHATAQFEVLNQAFFVEAVRRLPERCFMLLGFADVDGAERLVACELVLRDRDVLHPLYSGFDYRYKESLALYFNTFYRLVEEAERLGCRAVHLGQTAYEVKAELGAFGLPQYLVLHHRNVLVHRLLGVFRQALFPGTTIPYRLVFSKPDVARDVLTVLGIDVPAPAES